MNLKLNQYFLVTFGLLLQILAVPAQAVLVNTNSFHSATTIGFSDQTTQHNVPGQVQIGGLVGEDVTVESSSPSIGLSFNYDGWNLVDNGYWGDGQTYVSLNWITESMIFSFNDGPVAGVGAFMNYATGFVNPLVITALDSQMNVLESYELLGANDIVTPGGVNDGAFRGIYRDATDIYFFTLSGGYANVVDDLTFTRVQAVPLPTAFWLLGSGLLAFMGLGRHKKN